MKADRQFRHAHRALKAITPAVPAEVGPYAILRLYYSEEHDQFFLVSHDETTALPMPHDISGHMDDLRKPEDERLRCHPGFVEWPLRAIPGG